MNLPGQRCVFGLVAVEFLLEFLHQAVFDHRGQRILPPLLDHRYLRTQRDGLQMGFLQVGAELVQPVQHHVLLAVDRDQAGNYPLVAAIVVDRHLGRFELFLYLCQLAFEEMLRLFALMRVDFDTPTDELARMGIGQPRRQLRIGGGEADRHHLGVLDRGDVQCVEV